MKRKKKKGKEREREGERDMRFPVLDVKRNLKNKRIFAPCDTQKSTNDYNSQYCFFVRSSASGDEINTIAGTHGTLNWSRCLCSQYPRTHIQRHTLTARPRIGRHNAVAFQQSWKTNRQTQRKRWISIGRWHISVCSAATSKLVRRMNIFILSKWNKFHVCGDNDFIGNISLEQTHHRYSILSEARPFVREKRCNTKQNRLLLFVGRLCGCNNTPKKKKSPENVLVSVAWHWSIANISALLIGRISQEYGQLQRCNRQPLIATRFISLDDRHKAFFGMLFCFFGAVIYDFIPTNHLKLYLVSLHSGDLNVFRFAAKAQTIAITASRLITRRWRSYNIINCDISLKQFHRIAATFSASQQRTMIWPTWLMIDEQDTFPSGSPIEDESNAFRMLHIINLELATEYERLFQFS